MGRNNKVGEILSILKDIKNIENIGDLKTRQKEGLKYLINLGCKKNFFSEEVFEIIYLCINLYYTCDVIKEKYASTLKKFYLNLAEVFLNKYFNIKGDNCIFSNYEDVLMLIELAACFSLECMYGKSTELLIKIIENSYVDNNLKIRALDELFFESEKFLPKNKINNYKQLYNNLKH